METSMAELSNPKYEVVVKLQKVHKSFRTRRRLDAYVVVVEQKLYKHTLSLFHMLFFLFWHLISVVSKWSRARTRVAKMTHILNVRCALSSFVDNVQPLIDSLSNDAKLQLSDASITPLLKILKINQNIPLLCFLLRSYIPEKDAFKLGNYYVKFFVRHVALLLGLPNEGIVFTFHRKPFSTAEHKDLAEELSTTAKLPSTTDTDDIKVRLLIKYLLCKLFFPLKIVKISAALEAITSIEDFKRYNWPLAVHSFLTNQFSTISTKAAGRENDQSLGYMEGCSILLVISSFLEDAKSTLPMDISEWPFLSVPDVPQHVNEDCGVFVMKFMHILYCKEQIDWRRYKNMQKKMPKYRAKFAATILRTFAKA